VTLLGIIKTKLRKQVTAVIEEVKTTLDDSYDVSKPASTLLTESQIMAISKVILNGLINGEIEYKGDRTNTKKLTTYAKGLVSNHLRKHKLLNGNIGYKPTGIGPKRDERLRELNNLVKCGKFEEGTSEYDAIIEAIATRKQELATQKSTSRTKSKAAQIDTSVLPAALQGLATPESE